METEREIDRISGEPSPPPSPQYGQDASDFPCLLCGAGRFTASTMEQHIRLEHEKFEDEKFEDEAYSCMFCLFTALLIDDLQLHITEVHPEQFVCSLCLVTFSNKEEMKKHDDIHEGRSVIRNGNKDFKNNKASCGLVDESCRISSLLPDPSNKSPGNTNSGKTFSNCKDPNLPASTCKLVAESLSVVKHKTGEGSDILETSLRLNDCPTPLDESVNAEDEACENAEANEPVFDDDEGERDDQCNLQEILNFSQVLAPRTPDITSPSHENSDTAIKDCSLEGMKAKSVVSAPTEGQTFQNPEAQDQVKDPSGANDDAAGAIGAAAMVDHTLSCPFCPFQTSSEGEIERHVNQQHLPEEEVDDEDGSELAPNVVRTSPGLFLRYTCPFCAGGFDTPNDLSRHINLQHPEGEIGGGSSTDGWGSPREYLSIDQEGRQQLGVDSPNLCPICLTVFQDSALLATHMAGHFASPTEVESTEAHIAKDREVALRLQQEEKKTQESATNNYLKLQVKYGMDNRMSAKQQFERDLEQAISKGQITTEEFHQTRLIQAQSLRSGVDDGTTVVSGLIEKLQSFYDSRSCPRSVSRVCLSSTTHHYSGSFGDKGWGCGYRNLQMLLSCLVNEPTYFQVLFNGQAKMPSILKLQQLLEMAWRKGFDPQGCEQLGGTVVNTRRWIGATEVVALLSSLHIKCVLVDFTQPSGPDNTHPAMIQWVREYFTSSKSFKPALYLQHQGHSRTIVGIEQLHNGDTNLLIFDPGIQKDRMMQFHGQINYKLLHTIRKTTRAFRAKQFQIVAVAGILNDKECESSKLIRSTKIS